MLVDQALAEIESRKKMVLGWWTEEAVALSLKAKFPQYIGDYTPSLHWTSKEWKGIFITLHHVKNMTDLKPVFQFLGRHGYIHGGKPDIYEEIGRVTWTFNNIKLMVFFGGDDSDATCKFVKVGTKTVDDIKFICPDSPNGGI